MLQEIRGLRSTRCSGWISEVVTTADKPSFCCTGVLSAEVGIRVRCLPNGAFYSNQVYDLLDPSVALI
jgi:hypothetical protein